MSESKPDYVVPNWRQINATIYQLVCVKHCGHDPALMTGDPIYVTEHEAWCAYEDADGFCGHVCSSHGELVNRFSFNVQGYCGRLKPGEAEQIASMILREHNSHEALVEALRRSRDWMKEPMGGGLLHERFGDDKTCEADCLRCTVNAALALAEKES